MQYEKPSEDQKPSVFTYGYLKRVEDQTSSAFTCEDPKQAEDQTSSAFTRGYFEQYIYTVTLRTPDDLKNGQFAEQLAKLGPDALIPIEYNTFIRVKRCLVEGVIPQFTRIGKTTTMRLEIVSTAKALQIDKPIDKPIDEQIDKLKIDDKILMRIGEVKNLRQHLKKNCVMKLEFDQGSGAPVDLAIKERK
jgi:hypothetical protein